MTTEAAVTVDARVRGARPDYLRRRVVLTTRSEVSFCGIAREALEVGGREGVFVETDQRSGFGVWCPLDYVKAVTVIPVPVQG